MPESPFVAWVARYKRDPVAFVREVLGAEPDWYQVDLLESVAKGERHISMVSGHGVGKTTALAWLINWQLATQFPLRCVCTAPTGPQLYDVLANETFLWLKKLPDAVQSLFEQKTESIELKALPEDSFASFRTSRPETPEALAGVHCEKGRVLLICDEASGIPEQVFKAGIGSMSGAEACTILAGNGIRSSGLFFDTHHKLKSKWHTIRVNAEDIPRAESIAQEVIDVYGKDSNEYRVRVLGLFPKTDSDALIPFELKEAALTRDVKGTNVKPIWGVDVARYGGDRSVLCKRKGNVLVEPVSIWRELDTMEVTGRVVAHWKATPAKDRPEEICVDAIGYGAGVADRLRELRLPARAVNVSESPALTDQFINLRAELWWDAREWFTTLQCRLGGIDADGNPWADEALGEELCQVKYGYSSSGKRKVESKEEMKKRMGRSPDLADAFVLTFAGAAVSATFGSTGSTSWNEPLKRVIAGIV